MLKLTRSSKVEEVSDGDGNAVAHGGEGGSWVQHIGAKIGQLPGFMVAQASQADSFRHLPRVCAVDPIYICPDGDLASLEERSNNGGRVVTAITFQCSHLSKHEQVFSLQVEFVMTAEVNTCCAMPL